MALPQPGAEVKNEWSYTSTPAYVFMACTGTTDYYVEFVTLCFALTDKILFALVSS